MPEKKRKKMRGQPEIYDEVKGQVNLSLTATGVQGLDTLAQGIGLSRSELVEQIGRGILPIFTKEDHSALKKFLSICNLKQMMLNLFLLLNNFSNCCRRISPHKFAFGFSCC